jgi:hypothetical protein
VTITQDNTSQLFYLRVILPATKMSICTGVVVQGKSQVRSFNGKRENVEVSVAGQGKDKKMEMWVVKLQVILFY